MRLFIIRLLKVVQEMSLTLIRISKFDFIKSVEAILMVEQLRLVLQRDMSCQVLL